MPKKIRYPLWIAPNHAFILGVPTSLSSDLDLKIYVKNVNDHEPQFLIEEFGVNFTEHSSPGSERVKIVGTIDRDDAEDDIIGL